MKSRKRHFTKLIFPVLIGGLAIFLMYNVYLFYPQHFEVGQCIQNSRINEIYRIISPAHRDLSFKNHWFFGPMILDVQVHKPNPNTNRSIGDKIVFKQDDQDLLEIFCP